MIIMGKKKWGSRTIRRKKPRPNLLFSTTESKRGVKNCLGEMDVNVY